MRPEDDVAPARGVLIRAGVATRQVVATHGVAEVEPVWPQDEVAATAHGVVKPRDSARAHGGS
jgi:hypothetical protein